MISPLEKTLNELNGRQLRVVLHELSEVSREGVSKRYAEDPATREALAGLDQPQARAILDEFAPSLRTDNLKLSDEDIRGLLLALAAQPELEPYLRRALERRMLVSVPGEIAMIGALIVFVLSIKWKVKFKKSKDGKTEFEIEAGKTATPTVLLKELVSQVPNLGAPGVPGADGKA